MTEYYDIVLGAIPLSLLGISGLLWVVGLSLTVAIPLGAVVSVGLIGHAMFVNGPVDAVRNGPGRATDADRVDTAKGDSENPGPIETKGVVGSPAGD